MDEDKKIKEEEERAEKEKEQQVPNQPAPQGNTGQEQNFNK